MDTNSCQNSLCCIVLTLLEFESKNGNLNSEDFTLLEDEFMPSYKDILEHWKFPVSDEINLSCSRNYLVGFSFSFTHCATLEA